MSKTHSKRPPPPLYPRSWDLTGSWAFTYTRSLDPDRSAVPGASAFSSSMPVPGHWDDHHVRLQRADWWPSADLSPAQTTLSARRSYPEERAFETLQYLRGIGWYRRTHRLPAAVAGGQPYTALMEFKDEGMTRIEITYNAPSPEAEEAIFGVGFAERASSDINKVLDTLNKIEGIGYKLKMLDLLKTFSNTVRSS